MRKSLTYKILAAVMALNAANWAAPADVSAGYEEYGDYYVTADGETISKNYPNVYGNGYSFTITGGKIINVYGAGNGNKDYDKDASGGNVTINGNVEVTSVVCGGRSDGISAHHNTVNISDGSVTGNVFGGTSESGQAHHNIVNISGDNSKVTRVYGGRSVDRSAYHNIVNISGGSVGSVCGGWSYSDSANDNTVNISGGTIGADQWSVNVYGGRSYSGSANDNEIIISGPILHMLICMDMEALVM